jgi:hypothetical protein
MPIRGRGIDMDTMSVAEVQASTNTTLNATSSATGNVALTLGPFTLEGPGNFYVEVFTPSLVKGTTNVDLELWLDGAPGTGTVLTTLTGHLAASEIPCYVVVRVALTGGTHTLRVAGFVDAGSGTFTGGVGTTGTFPNSWARLWRA